MIKGRVGGNLIGWIGALWPNVLKIKKRIGQICSLYNISTTRYVLQISDSDSLTHINFALCAVLAITDMWISKQLALGFVSVT